MESAREGITKISEKIGKAAGAGMAVVGAGVAEAAGYHPTPMITVGAAYVGIKMGGLVGRAMNAGLDRVATANQGANGGQGGSGAIGAAMAQLSTALQELEGVTNEVQQAIDAVNTAQAYYQMASEGTGNNLLITADNHCRQAPELLRDGLHEVSEARALVGQHLLRVASGK